MGQRGVFDRSTQDHAGGHHSRGVRRILGALLEGGDHLESRDRLRVHRGGSVSSFAGRYDARAATPRLRQACGEWDTGPERGGETLIRHLLKAVLAGAVVCATFASSRAQDWPQRPLRIMVIAAPGGLPDVMARLVAKHLTETLGQPVVVENRPGAGGNMAALAVAKAAPDGYTLLLTGTNHATNPTLIPDAGFDYDRDLAPVTMVAEANMVLVAHPSLPANNVAEL